MRPTTPPLVVPLLYLTSLLACSRPHQPAAAPPPASRAADCAGEGIEQVEGVFAMTYGDPPAQGGRPRVSFTIALRDGATVVLLIDDELLGPHDAGRGMLGRRVAVAGDVVRAVPRTLRVCAITLL